MSPLWYGLFCYVFQLLITKLSSGCEKYDRLHEKTNSVQGLTHLRQIIAKTGVLVHAQEEEAQNRPIAGQLKRLKE